MHINFFLNFIESQANETRSTYHGKDFGEQDYKTLVVNFDCTFESRKGQQCDLGHLHSCPRRIDHHKRESKIHSRFKVQQCL